MLTTLGIEVMARLDVNAAVGVTSTEKPSATKLEENNILKDT